MDRSVERMLIIHQGALGDFLCCLPAMACVRSAFPQANMTLMGYPRVLDLVDNRYYANTVVSMDSADMAFLYQDGQEHPPALRDFLCTFQLIVVIGLNRDPFIRNLRTIGKAQVVVVPPFPPEADAVHMVDHLLGLPRRLGLTVHQDIPRLYLLEGDRLAAMAFFEDHSISADAVLVAIHPGSGSRVKTWPIEKFLELADRLVSTHDAQILFIAGPADVEIKHAFLRTKGPKPPVILDNLPLPQLGAILERCRVFVGNDSGITHMAAAIGVPVVAIFGPSDPARWAPRGREVDLIRRAVPCSPCERQIMSSCSHRRCLRDISVDEVCNAVQRIIKRQGHGPFYVEDRQSMSRERLEAIGILQ